MFVSGVNACPRPIASATGKANNKGRKFCHPLALVADKGTLKVHKIENFFDFDFGICVISLLVMHK